MPFIAFAVSLEAVLLIFRAVEIKSIPLTGLFESMIVLTIVFGLIYLFFTIGIKEVWFGSVMSWVILATSILAALVARPASEPNELTAKPWAIVHGIAMILSGVSIMLAAASAMLYLLANRGLKKKKVLQVLGKMPNIEKLGQMNRFGLKACFVLMTFGLASGIGLAITSSAKLDIGIVGWLTDPKIVLIVAVWGLLGIILLLGRIGAVSVKHNAYIIIFAFILILFAVVGTTLFCGTKHNFNLQDGNNIEVMDKGASNNLIFEAQNFS
ncbi:MAG: cytochrome c biogenesis protein CcsA [Phycisphaerae bacterium]|nr:cytochrome c biogenesis protein CcsA [Phycisphaerae bacterium]